MLECLSEHDVEGIRLVPDKLVVLVRRRVELAWRNTSANKLTCHMCVNICCRHVTYPETPDRK